MAKEKIEFKQFLEAAGAEHQKFVTEVHDFFSENNCVCEIKEAKNGYVVSYVHKPAKKTVANYVFRKKGLILRIYGDNIACYEQLTDEWPESMVKEVKKAGPCKRLLDPSACNSRCQMGYTFMMDEEKQVKCRYGSFMFLLDEETKPYLQDMLEREMQYRSQALLY